MEDSDNALPDWLTRALDDQGNIRHFDSRGRAVPLMEFIREEVEHPERHWVALTHFKHGDCFLSTVNLGIDTRFHRRPDKPLIFETAFQSYSDFKILARYSTRRAARKGHKRFLKRILKLGYQRRRS